jgi:hypothetical protein
LSNFEIREPVVIEVSRLFFFALWVPSQRATEVSGSYAVNGAAMEKVDYEIEKKRQINFTTMS